MTTSTTRRPFFRRRKSCPFSGANAPKIDYKDVKLLSRYVSERGKIVPSRITAVSQKKQRELAHRDQAGALPRADALRHSLKRLRHDWNDHAGPRVQGMMAAPSSSCSKEAPSASLCLLNPAVKLLRIG